MKTTAKVSVALIVVLTIALLMGMVITSQAQAVSYSSEEIKFVQLINDYRTSLGLNSLKVSDELSESGDRHGLDMGKYGFFDHYTARSDWFADGASPWDRMAASGYDYNTYKGENIAAGIVGAAEVFEAWKNSPSHNENMVNPEYKEMGVSLVYVAGSVYGCYWTTDFGGYLDPTAHTFGSSSPSTNSPFNDVGNGTLYADQIKLLAGRGVVSGYSDGSFGPYDPVTRQQFAKMIIRALGRSAAPLSACSFEDVVTVGDSSDPLYPAGYVAACAQQGITVGTTPYTFGPYDNITRAQLITMTARAAGLCEPPAGYQPPFSDFSGAHYQWARRAAYAGWLNGFQGMGPNFDFWASATRGEVCMLLAALVGK